MKISESQLRSIIKKEILNEFFGPFKRKPKTKISAKSPRVPSQGVTSARRGVPQGVPKGKNVKGSQSHSENKPKFRHNPELNLFFKKLESARSKIQKFQSILLKLKRGQSLGFDTVTAETEVLFAAEGLRQFIEKVFPLISKISLNLKEDKYKDINEINIMINEEMLILGAIFASELSDIDDVIRLDNKDIKYYMSALSPSERKDKEALVQFYVSIFRFVVKNKDSINGIIDKKLNQIKDASAKLGGSSFSTKRDASKKYSRNISQNQNTEPSGPRGNSLGPAINSKGFRVIDMNAPPSI